MNRRVLPSALVALLLPAGCGTSNSVEIDAPVELVWAYVGDSRNAAEWSVYFDHITPLPGEPDGRAGSRRRCYRRADETGIAWDERVERVEEFRLREIHTFAVRGFRDPLLNEAEYRVLQRFEPLPGGRTRLSFDSVLLRPRSWNAWTTFGSAKAEAERVVGLNLANIAAAVEARYRGVAYSRPHPYEPAHLWD
ncbi:MAG: SRPBCC family protein [Elusimicrobia bacterium]|nr:SRPBCC family protein [Elusimicrobiota bacterium]